MQDIIKELSEKLDATRPELDRLDTYFTGTQGASFLSPESKQALAGRMTQLSVNFPRLAATSVAERLEVSGFTTDSPYTSDRDLWKLWKRCNLPELSAQAHLDALIYGRSFVIVWASASGKPQITVESPRDLAVAYDPITGEVVAALKRWRDPDGYGRAVLMEHEAITLLKGSHVPENGLYASTGWTVTETLPNPLSCVPVVPLVNAARLADVDGVSEMADVMPLSDALSKLMQDAMVTSEYYARPRRWVTGMELVEDEDGEVVNPFSNEANRMWMSESTETRFGQLEPANLSSYADLTAILTQQIGAVSKLPPHYLGLNGDQPASADAIRSAEASLVSRAFELHRTFGASWTRVIDLVLQVLEGIDGEYEITVSWSNPETRTPAQNADAAAKLIGIGIPLETVMAEVLDFHPESTKEINK